MSFDYEGRVARLQAEMTEATVSWSILSIGSDLPYFTGYQAPYTERLTVLAIPQEGTPRFLVPKLEVPRIPSGSFELVGWSDTDDPVELLGRIVDLVGAVAVGDEMWATHLIDMMAIGRVDRWMRASRLTAPLRMVKEQAEIDALREAGTQADRVAGRIPDELRLKGATEAEIAGQIKRMLLEEGHDTAEFAIVGSGPNAASPHHDASSRTIEVGDMVVLDFGGSVRGYKSDTTRTFVVGEPTARQTEVYDVVRRANEVGRSMVAPAVRCEEVDQTARQVIADAGLGEFFVHRTGHGIGLDVHEHPYIVEGNSTQLAQGMCFSVEPGVYLPGEFGVRIEDIVSCTEDGVEELNESRRDLVVVG